MDRQVVTDIERQFRNAARRWTRSGNRDKAEAYRYAAWTLRQALKESA